MSAFTLPDGDSYDKRCGEVFLTLNGNIIFHCTLCENKYKGIHEYAIHIIEKHFDPEIKEDDCLSTCSSEYLQDEILDDAEMSDTKDFDAVLFEEVEQLEEVLREGDKDEEMIVLECDSTQNDNAFMKPNESIKEEMLSKINSSETESKKRQLERNRRQTIPKFQTKQEHKAPSFSEKIRIINEEAAKCLDEPTFKKPVARANIPDSERKHKCNFCGFSFKDQSNLIAHIKRHSGKKNFQCSYCSKMFCTRNEIEEHVRRHTGEKPYTCEMANCNKSYFTRSELNMHMKRHKNERNFICEVCQRAFYDRGDLREHFVSHTQERNHECIVCKAKFTRRKALINHMKLHENKREYECNICGASFNQKPGLNAHLKTKHKDA